MTRVHVMLLLGLALVLIPRLGYAQSEGSNTDSLIRLLSSELRQIENRLSEIDREMEPLPDVKKRPWGSRYGHRSADLPNETTADWVQLDLRTQRMVDLVALMPANLSYRGEEGAGYGFPKRFRIEISNHPDMRDAVVLVDRSSSDVPNPGKYPLVFEFEPVAGQYLRLTSLKHDFNDGAYFWALEELIAMEGNLLLARENKIDHSSMTELYPQWVPPRINDGQSALGMPVDMTTVSPTQGYLSDKLHMKKVADPLLPSSKKWCTVDLGKPEVIEQVCVLPLESEEYEVVGGRGYPRRFRVQLAQEPSFKQVIWENRMGDFHFGYPSGCSINVMVPRIEARYVRVIAERMWSRDGFYVFGLSELQVYGSNRNLALGKPVSVKDMTNKPPEDGWAPSHLVDGYTSRYRLIEWPEYLRQMDKRGRLERELVALADRRANKLSHGRQALAITIALLAFLVVTAWIWGMVRHKVLRRREAEQLRQQIARDLHDDIGSNLGGIVLLSEIGSQYCQDEEAKNDFKTIYQAAEDASLSMRDIIWLIQRERVGLKDFVTRMRQSLRMVLSHHDVSLQVEPQSFRDRSLGLLFRRHVFLAFKEVLNNVRKHAKTDRVEVKIEIEADRLRFTVSDEGIGFEPEKNDASGNGLNNLNRRASRVSGSILINSAPGKGTKVTFEAPFSH